MRAPWTFRSPLAEGIERFLAYKRALGRRFDTEQKQLRLFDRFLVQQALTDLAEITPDLVAEFLAARPRPRPRSYNQLLGVLRRLFDWLVTQEILGQSPLRALPHRTTAQRLPYLFDATQARRLLDLAGRLPDRSCGRLRGPTYRTIFALLYGLGLRVGEVSRLRYADVISYGICWSSTAPSSARAGWCRSAHGWPRCCATTSSSGAVPGVHRTRRSFPLRDAAACHQGRSVRPSTSSCPSSASSSPLAWRRRGRTDFATPSPSGRCSGGIAKALIRPAACFTWRRSSGTSIRAPRPST